MRALAALVGLSLMVVSLGFADPGQGEQGQDEQVAKELPEPFATKSVVKHPEVIGWPKGKQPKAPRGFRVNAFVTDIDNPRWVYVLPNGDVLISQARALPRKESKQNSEQSTKEKEMIAGLKKSRTVTGDSPNKITLLRDGDGRAEVQETFLEKLNQPFGMVLVGDTLFVAETDAVQAYPYKKGQTKIDAEPMKILDLPAGGYNDHWTHNLVTNEKGSKLYITVGSASNVAEYGTAEEMLRAKILECNLDGTELRVFAAGLRNPVGMDWKPKTGRLWTAVNARDELGDELVPDYITSVKEGGWYGWPFSYFGDHEDPRRKGGRPDLVKKAIVPDFALGSHTASLGLAFYDGKAFPEKYRGGAFIGQRGSWNRSKFAGYRVAFVPFKEGYAFRRGRGFSLGFHCE